MKLNKGTVALTIWVVATFTALSWLRSEYNVLTTLERLDTEVKQVSSLLNVNPAYQTNHLDNLAISTRVINETQVELLASQDNHFVFHDVNQLILLLDRFTHLVEQLSDNKLQKVRLLEELGMAMDEYRSEPRVFEVLTELGSLTFIALYSDFDGNSLVYRKLDALYVDSLELPDDARTKVQSLLARSSNSLGAYAQGAHWVEQLAEFEVTKTISEMRQELYHHIYVGGILFAAVGFLPLLIALYRRPSMTFTPSSALVTDPAIDLGAQHVTQSDTPDAPPEPKSKPTVTVNPERTSAINYAYMLDSVSGDKNAVELLLNVFIEDHQDDAERIQALIGQQDPTALRLVHSLKGVAGSVGATPLRDIASDLESNLKKGQPIADSDLELLALYLRQTVQSAEDYRGR